MMKLTPEQQAILDGAQGETMAKVMKTQVMYGEAFGAEKMNYELLGNGDTHLHWHLFPRRAGDLDAHGHNGKGPVWWYPADKMYDDSTRPTEEELEAMKAALLRALNQ